MNNYTNMLMEIKNKVINNELKYKNTLIIGDNSSGKSELLKEIIRENLEEFYFIDSVNRTFDYTKATGIDDLPSNGHKLVLKNRLNEDKFNLEDSFNLYEAGDSYIEQIYFNFKEELSKLVNDFLGVDFHISKQEDVILGSYNKLYVDEEYEKLSSGYQAIIRMFLELIYFTKSKGDSKEGIVIIDEINEFLSAKNEEKILPFLMKEFEDCDFIVTTHSADVISSSIDCNLIVLKDNKYECLDGNDFSTVTDVREIFESLYNIGSDKDEETVDIEDSLRNLLNLRISGTWSKNEEDRLIELENMSLSNANKLIVTQIRNWVI